MTVILYLIWGITKAVLKLIFSYLWIIVLIATIKYLIDRRSR